MRLVLSGGGTGGHVYPALSVAEAVRELLPAGEALELLYVGTLAGNESQIVERAEIPFRDVSAAPIRGRLPWGFSRIQATQAQRQHKIYG